MAFLNYLLQFKFFSDKKPSNSPNLSSVDWVRDIQGVIVANPSSQVFTVPASGSITVFTSASKKFLYLESDSPLDLTINGLSTPLHVLPVVVGSAVQSGSFLMTGTLTSLVISNPSSTAIASVYVTSAE